MKKFIKIFNITTIVLLLIISLPFICLQIATTQSVSNKLLKKYVPEYLNADVSINKIEYDLLSSFPDINLRLYNVNVISKVFEPADTLLKFDSLKVSVNIMQFINDNAVQLNYCVLGATNINLKTLNCKNNYDIVLPTETQTDTTATEIPDLFLNNIEIINANFFYNDYDKMQHTAVNNLSLKTNLRYLKDSISAVLNLKTDSIKFIDNPFNCKYSISDFSLAADGYQNNDSVHIYLSANTPNLFLNDSLLDLNKHKLNIILNADVDNKFKSLCVNDFNAMLDDVSLSAKGDIKILNNINYYIDIIADINIPKFQQVSSFLPKPLEQFRNHKLAGAIKINAKSKGVYANGKLPVINAELAIDDVSVYFKKVKELVRLDLHADACYNTNNIDSTFLDIKNLDFIAENTNISLKGRYDYKNKKEFVDIKLLAKANLDVLAKVYPIEGINVAGMLNADINSNFFLSDLKQKHIYKLYSNSKLNGDKLVVNMPKYNFNFEVDSLRSRLNTNTEVYYKKRNRRDTSLVNLKVAFKTMRCNYKESINASMNKFVVKFVADDITKGLAPRFNFSVISKGLQAQANDTVKLNIKRMSFVSLIDKYNGNKYQPAATVKFSFDSMWLLRPQAGSFLDSTRISFTSMPKLKNKHKVNGKRVLIKDSEREVIDMDSLISLFTAASKTKEPFDFFIKRFNNEGHIFSKKMVIRRPLFPLRIAMDELAFNFNNDTLSLNHSNFRLGKSNLTLSGDVYNVRKYLLRGKMLSGDLKLESKCLDLNEFCRASYQYNEAVQSINKDSLNALNVIDDTKEPNDTDIAVADSSSKMGLFIIPNNLDISFNSQIDSVYFSKMKLSNFTGNITMRNQVLRVKQISTNTEIGRATMNLKYECKSPRIANTAVAIDLDSVQVGDLVTAMPMLDSIMPMLRSFDGVVGCELSTTANLDSTMNIELPSVNASAWLRGDSLVLMDGETFSEIAKMLMFKKKTKNIIDSISVEMLVKENHVEIFPFMVSMDKYRLGVGGKQNLDMSFNYHVVLLKSFLPFMAAVDVYGKDFDDINFKLALPKFKDSKTIIKDRKIWLSEEDRDIRKNIHNKILNEIILE